MNDDWAMGALAAQDQYKPFSWGSDPWVNRLGPTSEMVAERDAEAASRAAAQRYQDQQVANADETQAYRGTPRLDPGLRREPGSVAPTPVAQLIGDVGGEILTDPLTYLPGGVATKLGKGLVALGTMGGVLNPTEAQAGAGKTIKDLASSAANPRLRAKAEALHGTYGHYAEQYPPIGPPELMQKLPDPKNPGKFLSKGAQPIPYLNMEEALAKDATPGFFLEKKLTPEVERFQKDRAIIQKDMDVNGYTPYFDPAKRFEVNPKHYGPFADTATAAVPAKAETDALWYARYGTPENRAKLQAGFAKGQTVPESEHWYWMGQLEKEYIKELGAKAGREAFKREFGDMMAATTGGASPTNNFLMSQYANVMAKAGERMPERSYNLPFPIGGRFAATNIDQAQKYVDAGMKGFDPAINSKRFDFSSAFTGNPNAMTIDEQMFGALRPKTTKSDVNAPEWYGPATRVAREEAAKSGRNPIDFQDVAWAGLKAGKEEAAGKALDYEGPMINHINMSIERTHRLTGMPREEIVRRGLIRKEIPMYGLAGAAAAPVISGAMGSLADQSTYQER